MPEGVQQETGEKKKKGVPAVEDSPERELHLHAAHLHSLH